MKKYSLLTFLFFYCSANVCGQIPEILVYQDSVLAFYAWNDSLIKKHEIGQSWNRTVQVTINNRITHEYKKDFNFITVNNVLSGNDTRQSDIIFSGDGIIFRLSLSTGKVDTLLTHNPYTVKYFTSAENKLIGEMNDLSLISYNLYTTRIDTLHQFGEYNEEHRQYSIWGVDNYFNDLLFIVFGDGYNMQMSYFIYNLQTNEMKNFEVSEEKREESIRFSHYDISKKYLIMDDYWINSSFDRVQPTLPRSSVVKQEFKLNSADLHYYLYSTVDEPLRRNGSSNVWLTCRFTLPFDLCLYKIYNNQLLVQNEISDFDEWELHKLKNMIFAKHNYQFDSHYLQAFYNMFAFYRSGRTTRTKEVNSKLTAEDHANLRLINDMISRLPKP